MRALLPLALLLLGSVPPASADSTTVERPVYTLALRGGDTLQIVYAESFGHGSIRYVTTDMKEGFLVAGKVVSLRDSKGFNLADDLTLERKTIGGGGVESAGRDLSRRPSSDRVSKFLLGRRAERRRESKWFWVSEIGVGHRMADPPEGGLHGTTMVTLDVGPQWRMGRDWALGGVGHVSFEGDFTGWGLGVRARRWVGEYWSIEGTLGALLSADPRDYDLRSPPPFGEVSVNWNDAVSFFTSVERVRQDRGAYIYWGLNEARVSERDDDRWRIGIRTGCVPPWGGLVANVVGLFASVPADRSLR
jgi:hypothetical protein